MKIELESLAPKFEACRSRAKGKRISYPKLRKAAAHLIEDHSHKTLGSSLEKIHKTHGRLQGLPREA